jgi:hypothetical protein
METRSVSLWKTLDWVTIGIYLLLIIGGWFSVCGASYDYGDRDFLDFLPAPVSNLCGLSVHLGLASFF